MRAAIAVHGHFYQPPRESPWTGTVERQPSAAPDHDWNARIARECYLPNAGLGNLERISFNFGPTLLSWADRAHPQLSAAVSAADRAAVARSGTGRALAQLFSHPIAPLLSERDRRTQVRWGIADFERRYGRRPRGMWLPECAVDLPSLRTLAEEGIAFTILDPNQAEPAGGAGSAGSPDPREPALVDLGAGRSIAVFFFDRHLSQAIAFGDTLASAPALVDALKRAALAAGPGSLVLAATDGETFGHHKSEGARSLQGALAALEADPDVEITTPEAWLAARAPARRAAIRERTAWSCVHGLGRWTANCGCRISDSQQSWRGPLREAVDTLAERLHAAFEREGGAVFRDPWDARDRAAGLPPEEIRSQDWLREALRDPASESDARRALRLLEMERQLLFAHTSCGWFFDDVGGIEPVQNLRYAARAIELSGLGGAIEEEFLAILRRAPSNDPLLGDGAAIYRRRVLRDVLDPLAIAARAAFTWTLRARDGATAVHDTWVSAPRFSAESRGLRVLASGVLRVAGPFDLPETTATFAGLALADGELFVHFGPAADPEQIERALADAHAAFRAGRLPELLAVLARRFPLRLVHADDLSPDESAALRASAV